MAGGNGGIWFGGNVSFGGDYVDGDKVVTGDEKGRESKKTPRQSSRAKEGRRPGSGKTVRGEVLESRTERPKGKDARGPEQRR